MKSKAPSVGGLFHFELMSLVGTERTRRDGPKVSVRRVKAEVALHGLPLQPLTRGGGRAASGSA
jgi:hypothetical protein